MSGGSTTQSDTEERASPPRLRRRATRRSPGARHHQATQRPKAKKTVIKKRPVCTVCGGTFSKKANLKAHERIHTGERRYGCDICLKRFVWKSSLNFHNRTAHIELRKILNAPDAPQKPVPPGVKPVKLRAPNHPLPADPATTVEDHNQSQKDTSEILGGPRSGILPAEGETSNQDSTTHSTESSGTNDTDPRQQTSPIAVDDAGESSEKAESERVLKPLLPCAIPPISVTPRDHMSISNPYGIGAGIGASATGLNSNAYVTNTIAYATTPVRSLPYSSMTLNKECVQSHVRPELVSFLDRPPYLDGDFSKELLTLKHEEEYMYAETNASMALPGVSLPSIAVDFGGNVDLPKDFHDDPGGSSPISHMSDNPTFSKDNAFLTGEHNSEQPLH